MKTMPRLAATLAALAVALPLAAQQPAAPSPIKRTMLQKVDVAGLPGVEIVTAMAEIVPNVNIGKHTHYGAETGYVMEGAATLIVDGKAPVTVNAGESYQIPGGVPHDARSGDQGTKLLVVYVVEKGKALATPAP